MALDTWVMVGSWHYLVQFGIEEFLDRMAEAGVGHLAFGAPLPLQPDPANYADSPVKGQAPPPEIMACESFVRSFFRAARDRGVSLYCYGTNPHMNGVKAVYQQLESKRVLAPDQSLIEVDSYWQACASSPGFLSYHLGRIRDAHQFYPEVDGFLNDGPEFGYEIAPGFMADNLNLFGCFGPCCQRQAQELGYDFEELKQAAMALMGWLRHLDLAGIERMLEHPGKPLEALAAGAGAPHIEAWLRFKQDAIVSYVRGLCQGVKEVDPALSTGVGSRLPAFVPLTGYDLRRLASHADFLLPKIYLWMGGVDGLYGTVYRWANTLHTWNADLPEELLFRFAFRLFAFELPDVGRLHDMERNIETGFQDTTLLTYLGEPFPNEFFTRVVADQVSEMIAQIGEAGRVRPWLHTHHGGRALTPHELDLTLSASESVGLQTYLNYCPIEPGTWEVAVKHGKK